MAIAKLHLTDQALLGLNGELLLLDAMLRQAERDELQDLIVAWYGWRESTRDFSRNSVGIEVKTTTRAVSTHQVQGVHQLELLDHSDSGDSEHKLFLVSIGLEWIDADGDLEVDREHFYTLPALVDSIVQQVRDAVDELAADEVVEAFVSHVLQYGEDHDIGYHHHTMSGSAAYSRQFVQRFVRCYDMLDPGIEVLRSEDLLPLRHVSRGSVRFQIELPPSIHGDFNPVVGLNSTAKLVVEASRGR
ncbi:hypothetical protein GY24_05235 [Microterricola pindariensis]|uniref:PD-(D/E)XK motif protein n=1 Tax=Microterricola pindariensis TaxID=478010 RepID=A0ABX5AXP1_9MICO|nr:hypothetical protein GY24_05235 [Microterricola pindariensis]